MKIKSQKRLASDILKVGKGKIWLDPLRLDDIKQAITRADIQELIKDKAIKKKPAVKKKKVVKRKRRGKGRIKVRVRNRKKKYVNKIRKIRRYLDQALEKKEINKSSRDKLRKLSKSGHFRSLRHLKESLKVKVKK